MSPPEVVKLHLRPHQLHPIHRKTWFVAPSMQFYPDFKSIQVLRKGICDRDHLRELWTVVFEISRSDKIFVGFKKDEQQLDAEFHHKYIYGGHVDDYMRSC